MKIKRTQKTVAAALLATSVLMTTFTEAYAQTPTVVTPEVTIVKQKNSVQTKSTVPVLDSKEALIDALTEQMRKFETTASYVVNDPAINLNDVLDEAVQQDDYVYGTYAGARFKYRTTRDQMSIDVEIDYHHTASEERQVSQYVADRLNELMQPNMTAIEKIKAIHDDVILKTTYTAQSNVVSVHSPYAITQYGIGVCQAYALLTYRMLTAAGFETRYVTGEAGGVGHAWNLVKVDGTWYHLDTTWDDPVFQFGEHDEDYIGYDYFLISDAQILKNHTIDAGYPTASQTNYFPALIGNTTLLNFNRQPMMNLASYVDNIWYYAKAGTYQLTSLENGIERTLTSQKAFVPTYANHRIYFIGQDARAYHYDIATEIVIPLALAGVTNIRLEEDAIVFYTGTERLQSEAIQRTSSSNEGQQPTPVAEQPTQPITVPQNDAPAQDETPVIVPPVTQLEDESVQVDEEPVKDIPPVVEPLPNEMEPTPIVEEKTPQPVQEVTKEQPVAKNTTTSKRLDTFYKKFANLEKNDLYSYFKDDAEAAIAAYEKLTSKERKSLTAKQRSKITDLKKKLKKLKTFSKSAMSKGKAKKTSLSKKTWTLTLKSAVKNTKANRQKVVMYDQFGDKVACTVTIKGKKIKVKPKKAYVSDVPYVIHVPKKIGKTNGKALQKETNMKFTYVVK